MLVLKRRRDESVIVGDNVEIKVLEINSTTVTLGFNAPKEVSIFRAEVLARRLLEGARDRILQTPLARFVSRTVGGVVKAAS